MGWCRRQRTTQVRWPFRWGQFGSLIFKRQASAHRELGQDRRLWDANTGKELRRFTGHSDRVTSAAISPDGEQVLTGSWDKTVRLWDSVSGKELRQFIGHSDRVYAVAFSPDGKHILTGARIRPRACGTAPPAKNFASSSAIRIGFIRWPIPRMASTYSREVGIRPRCYGTVSPEMNYASSLAIQIGSMRQPFPRTASTY